MGIFTNTGVSAGLLVLGIILFILLCYKGLNTGIAALISALVVSFGTGDVIGSMFTTFPTGVGNFLTDFFWLFTTAGLLGYLMQETGASLSIGNQFVKWLGIDRAPYVLAITTTILLMAGVGTYIFVLVPLAQALMASANLPRRIGLVACVGIAPCISFCLPIANVPNSLPSSILGTSPFGAPVLSITTGVVGIVLFVIYLHIIVKQARKLNLGYDGPKMEKSGEELRDEQKLPSFVTSIAALIAVLVMAIFLSNAPEAWGVSANAAVALAQLSGSIVLIACNFKKCKEELGIVNILSKGATSMWPFVVMASCVMGFGQVIQQSACFQVIIDWVFGLNMNPYVMALISIAIVAGLCADGITAMMMWLPIFGAQYIAMGVNPQALHRLLVSTTQTFDSLPHSHSTATSLAAFGLSHKEGYGGVFVTTVIIPVVFSTFCCIMCMIFYPV